MKTKINISLFYFFIFFSLGGFFPLLPVYLREEVQLSGTQIGMLMSIIPVVKIVSQPLWGMICDYLRKPRLILTFTLIVASSLTLPYLVFNKYYIYIIFAVLLAVFQSAAIPISDSLTFNYIHKHGGSYGNYRLWGSIGFAVAALIMGKLSEYSGTYVIFFAFTISMLICSFFAWHMPGESASIQSGLRSGILKLLKLPQFMLFLLASLSIFGPMVGHMAYFGIMVQDLGGTLTGVGIAIFLAAGSEVPFMLYASAFIRKSSLLHVLVFAAIISGIRWIFYFFAPPISLVYLTTIAQGISIGLYIPAALQYVREIAPEEVKTTAVAFYTAIGASFGNWFSTFFGGIILDKYNVFTTYLFYGFSTFVGVMILLVIVRLNSVLGVQLSAQ